MRHAWLAIQRRACTGYLARRGLRDGMVGQEINPYPAISIICSKVSSQAMTPVGPCAPENPAFSKPGLQSSLVMPGVRFA